MPNSVSGNPFVRPLEFSQHYFWPDHVVEKEIMSITIAFIE